MLKKSTITFFSILSSLTLGQSVLAGIYPQSEANGSAFISWAANVALSQEASSNNSPTSSKCRVSRVEGGYSITSLKGEMITRSSEDLNELESIIDNTKACRNFVPGTTCHVTFNQNKFGIKSLEGINVIKGDTDSFNLLLKSSALKRANVCASVRPLLCDLELLEKGGFRIYSFEIVLDQLKEKTIATQENFLQMLDSVSELRENGVCSFVKHQCETSNSKIRRGEKTFISNFDIDDDFTVTELNKSDLCKNHLY